jgi:hypothetical protein
LLRRLPLSSVGSCANFPVRSGLRRALLQLFRRDLFPSNGADTWDTLLPTFAHTLESSIVVREHEAGVDKAKARSVFNPGKDKRNDSVQR